MLRLGIPGPMGRFVMAHQHKGALGIALAQPIQAHIGDEVGHIPFHDAPVAAVLPFADEDEAIALANDSDYGLAAYLYAQDMGRICRVSDALEYGMVAVNCAKMTGAPIPFGGMKQSGLGREGSRYGMDDYTELKYVCLGGIGR